MLKEKSFFLPSELNRTLVFHSIVFKIICRTFTYRDQFSQIFLQRVWIRHLIRSEPHPASSTLFTSLRMLTIILLRSIYINATINHAFINPEETSSSLVWPHYALPLLSSEIYMKVVHPALHQSYFRPFLESIDCPCDELADVIKSCWAEDPSDRPDFPTLKSVIRKLNKYDVMVYLFQFLHSFHYFTITMSARFHKLLFNGRHVWKCAEVFTAANIALRQ